jgi:hypothetical protein
MSSAGLPFLEEIVKGAERCAADARSALAAIRKSKTPEQCEQLGKRMVEEYGISKLDALHALASHGPSDAEEWAAFQVVPTREIQDLHTFYESVEKHPSEPDQWEIDALDSLTAQEMMAAIARSDGPLSPSEIAFTRSFFSALSAVGALHKAAPLKKWTSQLGKATGLAGRHGHAEFKRAQRLVYAQASAYVGFRGDDVKNAHSAQEARTDARVRSAAMLPLPPSSGDAWSQEEATRFFRAALRVILQVHAGLPLDKKNIPSAPMLLAGGLLLDPRLLASQRDPTDIARILGLADEPTSDDVSRAFKKLTHTEDERARLRGTDAP